MFLQRRFGYFVTERKMLGGLWIGGLEGREGGLKEGRVNGRDKMICPLPPPPRNSEHCDGVLGRNICHYRQSYFSTKGLGLFFTHLCYFRYLLASSQPTKGGLPAIIHAADDNRSLIRCFCPIGALRRGPQKTPLR